MNSGSFLALLSFIAVALAQDDVTTYSVGQSVCISTAWCMYAGLSANTGLTTSINYHNKYLKPATSLMFTSVRLHDNADPETARKNIDQFARSDPPFAIVSMLGTPTSVVALQSIIKNDFLFVGPISGARDLRSPFYKNVVNLRTSVIDEIKTVFAFLRVQRDIRSFALLQSNDQYGEDVLAAIQSVVEASVSKNTGFEFVGKSMYDPFGEDMHISLTTLKKMDPQAIIVCGTSDGVSDFLDIISTDSWTPTIVFLSYDTDGFIQEVTAKAPGYTGDIYVSTVFPSPNDTQSTLAQGYLGMTENITSVIKNKKNYQYPSFNGFESYVAINLIIEVLKDISLARNSTANITRQDFINRLYQQIYWYVEGQQFGPFYLPGIHADYPEGSNQGMHTSYIYKVDPASGALQREFDMTHSGNGLDALVQLPTPLFQMWQIILIIVLAVLALIFLGLFLFFFIRKKYIQKQRAKARARKKSERQSFQPVHFKAISKLLGDDHNVLVIRRGELSGFTLIGTGSFSKVYRAIWNEKVVAIKHIHNPLELRTDSVVKEIADEITMWNSLSHPNIITFYGVTKDLWIVMEYMEHGSLRSFVTINEIGKNTKRRLMSEVAMAVDYLHSRSIIHRDLNPNNIMVTGHTSDLHSKIADFGLSRSQNKESLVHTKSIGTPVYSAPEVLSDSVFTTHTDAYSFGLTLYFVDTRTDPYENCASVFDLMDAVCVKGIRPDTSKCPTFKNIVDACIRNEPSERPPFSKITSLIQSEMDNEPVVTVSQDEPTPVYHFPSMNEPAVKSLRGNYAPLTAEDDEEESGAAVF